MLLVSRLLSVQERSKSASSAVADEARQPYRPSGRIRMLYSFPWAMSSRIAEACLKNVTEEMGDEAAAKVQVPKERQFSGFRFVSQ